ncbi:MAG: HDIG domain-containing protein [Bacillota bacterium]|nr:HDIG domain-containing protein [Bacillota bacterium]
MRTDSKLSKKIDNLSKSILLLTLLPIISVFIVGLTGMLNKMEFTAILKISIITLLLTSIILLYIRLSNHILKLRFAKSIIIISYIVSLLLIMLPNNPQIYSFWMLGGILIAMVIDSKLGLLVYFNITFILSIRLSLEPETIIHFLIMGILFVLLSNALKSKSTVIYASIILLSTNITLAFIMNNFFIEAKTDYNYLASFFSIFAVLVTAFLLSSLHKRVTNNYLLSKEETIINSDDTKDAINSEIKIQEKISLVEKARTSYDVLLSDDNELLLRMKNYSENLYKHCKLIGDLSGRAANYIDADEDLARAGGYYHEVGKIIGKNYIEEGLKLAEEYSFPEKLKEIIKQHNIKYDKPTFIEAAIVMISDNVATTIEYIDKTGDQKFTSDKIIDNIFRIRMDKGTFDESGLSVRDFKLLKEFYKKEFGPKDSDKA